MDFYFPSFMSNVCLLSLCGRAIVQHGNILLLTVEAKMPCAVVNTEFCSHSTHINTLPQHNVTVPGAPPRSISGQSLQQVTAAAVCRVRCCQSRKEEEETTLGRQGATWSSLPQCRTIKKVTWCHLSSCIK